ncbi:type VI secretion system-associated protein VasI [Marinomonas sp. S3726]|uniref:type VI secretion system-associated protein VasI n=1 Tax=Marinomonas sp. S3726 TaxID=579484 RepID=UPI0006979398|nr:type VI secretion system-associated protein VasI [Marinomonas sp. S3726]
MRVSFLCIYIFLSLSANAWAQDNQAMEDIGLLKGLGVAGVECSLVASRLARLSCFDDVFGTEFEVDEVAKSSLPIKERAMSSELEREDSSAFKITYGDTPELNDSIWVTSSAMPNLEELGKHKGSSTQPSTPILMLSCLETISRVELVLPQKLQDARVKISIFGDQKDTQTWVSDEEGFVLRTGRGVPAIKAMKAIISSRSLVLRSNSPVIDGLRFDSLNLASTIKPIREKCDW